MTETLLKLSCYISRGKPYYRTAIPARIVKQLGLREGDKILVDIKKVVRRN